MSPITVRRWGRKESAAKQRSFGPMLIQKNQLQKIEVFCLIVHSGILLFLASPGPNRKLFGQEIPSSLQGQTSRALRLPFPAAVRHP
jgi:hypothetical protein